MRVSPNGEAPARCSASMLLARHGTPAGPRSEFEIANRVACWNRPSDRTSIARLLPPAWAESLVAPMGHPFGASWPQSAHDAKRVGYRASGFWEAPLAATHWFVTKSFVAQGRSRDGDRGGRLWRASILYGIIPYRFEIGVQP